jgi:hypothetical protein
MSKKNKKREKETTIENYYDLKTKEMDDLVAALKDDGSKSSQDLTTDIETITGEHIEKGGKKAKNFDPYKRDKLSFIPTWLKALFIKWWFAGAVCYFIVFGIGNNMNNENLMLLTGVVLGIVVDVLINPIFRMIESDKKEFNNYMMFPFPFKAYWTFLTNIVYYVIVLFIVSILYGLVNEYIYNNIGVEPLLFGTFSLIIDMVFIGIKDLIVHIVKRNKNTKNNEVLDV